MKLYTFFTPAHAVFFERYLAPSVDESFMLHPIVGKDRTGGNSEFGSAGWLETMVDKARAMRKAVADNPGELIVWADSDIIFFDVNAQSLSAEIGPAGMVAQQSYYGADHLCAGFWVARATKKMLAVMDSVVKLTPRCKKVHDQEALNRLRCNLDYRLLPTRYWHYDLGFRKRTAWNGEAETLVSPPPDIAMVHATFVSGRTRKIEFLDWVANQVKTRADVRSSL